MDTVYRLALKTALHVGSSGVGHEGTLAYLPADTLFGALVITWAWQDPAGLDGRLAGFRAGAPPCLLTSAFPYAGPLRFYPRPEAEPNVAEATRDALGKRLKKVAYVSEGLLRRWLAGDALDDTLVETDSRRVCNLLQDERVWVTDAERLALAAAFGLPADEPQAFAFWDESIVPHVTVDRLTSNPNLHHTGRVTFLPGCGLWFGATWRDAGSRAWVEGALAQLADAGMGGLRSIGHGAFTFTAEAGPALPAAQTGDRGLLLSRAALKPDQMAALTAAESSYRLVTVGGWCGNDGEPPRLRRPVRLVGEGSLVAWVADPLGGLADVSPARAEDRLSHDVYRYGYALGLRAGA